MVTLDRKAFLEMAGRYAMTQDPKYTVTHEGIPYYPVAYICGYDIGEPRPFHKVILHDMKANSIMQTLLSEVEPRMKEETDYET